MPLATLKTRAEFLRVRGGSRSSSAGFTLECKPRPVSASTSAGRDGDVESSTAGRSAGPPRFGFTVTKKLGGAVRRNRIRRRLKAVVLVLAETHARRGYDYVLIARPAAFDQPFAALKNDLADAFHRVHHPRRAKRPPP
ncbi:MAG: ribonuclease P protein component [Hyphomicrobiaceae bacterium]|nr:ribonuclease P protein component [Hyphomicrobiaceae bacterium]MCC0007757.1 ribonuclease P protein component [Hyphomicrobiaceae bacterium]